MRPVRLGAVAYLNARPLVFGLDRQPRFTLRYDLPSECARLLEAGEVDLGLVPSIEYLRDPAYRIVPGLAIASCGPVASVALFTKRPVSEVRSIVMDTSSRTSVALVRVLCARLFRIDPVIEALDPNLDAMLDRGDAALVIGDNALLWQPRGVEKIDLGSAWTALTGLPFVWAFWVGRAGVVDRADVEALVAARDTGLRNSDSIARAYFADAPHHQALGTRYLRDNIKYDLGGAERAGLERFYRYASEIGLAQDRRLEFFS
jgi:chorismate dehydratase